uniref:FMRFamide-5 n=1 Tax=Sarcophaga bullata TaxID=7385 RepID=FAR5_SARBU|nr:RecName: Full=FMRFamide-5; AltName: Full=SabFMRFamide-5 [Sarcophaga bullata]
LSPTQDFMRF